MRILFLDDDINRHATFSRQSVGLAVDYIFDATSAIEKMTEGQYDVVLLDHDLGGIDSENKILDGVEDGRYVVRWISAHADRFENTTFIVHSLNPVGRQTMVTDLRSVGLNVIDWPFAWKELRFENS